MWLGSTLEVPYTEIGAAILTGLRRTRLVCVFQGIIGAGMITGWGQHHYDSAAWVLNTSFSGPISVAGIG